MDERYVDFVSRILDAVKEIAGPGDGRRGGEHPFIFHLGIAGQRWRRTLAQECEDQAQVLLRGIAADLDALAERLRLRRLLDALPIRPVDPAVIEAAQVVSLHPP